MTRENLQLLFLTGVKPKDPQMTGVKAY